MTWSIIAREPESGLMGIAMASRFFALGARVPYWDGGVGIVATQALLNPLYGRKGLALLGDGIGAHEVVERLVAADAGHAARQVHVMDASGASAAFTGASCVDWCGHRSGDGVSVAGNMLAGPEVVERTLETFVTHGHLPLPRRLIAAMKAGEAAGGDRRGRQSAGLVVVSGEEYSDLDIRVDDHADPLQELERLEAVSRERWVHFRTFLATRADPVGTTDRTVIDKGIAEALAREGAQ